MLPGWGILILLLLQAVVISSLPISVKDHEQTSSLETGNARGLISDFYTETMQKFPITGLDNVEREDFGDKFTSAVVQTALVLGDIGVDIAVQTLREVGPELVEAFKMKK